MLNISLFLLVFYLSRSFIVGSGYPDALIILFLIINYCANKYLEYRKVQILEDVFKDEIKKELQEVKNHLNSLKLVKGNIFGK